MALTHRASIGCAPVNPTTTFTVTIPATVVAGDVLFLSVTNRDGVQLIPTVVDTDTGGNTWACIGSNANYKGTLWWKRATSGTASKVITVANCIGSAVGTLSCYYGADTSATPYSNISVETNIAADETHAGFTPDVAGSMICLSVHNVENDNAVTSPACTDPGALTIRIEDSSTGGGDCGCNHSSAIESGGNPTGNFTWVQTDGATISIVWAIKPTSVTTVDQTITSLARIQKTVDQTQTALARIAATTDKTINAIARIQKTVDQTIDSLARVTATTDKTIGSLARITATTTKTIDALARITATTDKTISAIANIETGVTTDQPITAKARIQKTVDQPITGQGAVLKTVDRTIDAVARIQKTTDRTITSLGKIVIPTDQPIYAIARIQKTIDQTITAIAKITGITTKTIATKALMMSTVSAPSENIIATPEGKFSKRISDKIYIEI